MPEFFQPRLEILTPGQRKLWDKFTCIPANFILCGETAIALHLGHRQSVDFDFFSAVKFDPDKLLDEFPIFQDCRIIQKDQDTLTCSISDYENSLISLFYVPSSGKITTTRICDSNHVAVAGLLELAAYKLQVIQKRAELKDYLDLIFMLEQQSLSLNQMINSAVKMFGSKFNPSISLRALTYFEEGDVKLLKKHQKALLLKAVREFNFEDLQED